MDARAEAEKRYPKKCVTQPWRIDPFSMGRRDDFLAGAVWALREFGDLLEAVPDYNPTAYDDGRVEQRHMDAESAYSAASRIEGQ